MTVTHVHVVGVEVVGDVGIDPGPRLECLELEFGLGHVGTVEVELAKLLGAGSGIVVCGTKFHRLSAAF